MTSEQRKELRYERRKAKREERKQQRSDELGGIQEVFSYNELYKAGKQSCRGVRWKNSTQRFELHLFSGTARRRKLIMEHRWVPAAYVHFTLCERGKVRPIDAPRIQDRQVHKAYTRNTLLPLYEPDMIWNNGASLPGKGYEFSKKTLKKELCYHYKRYGTAGSIILIDFKQYFPTAPHQTIFDRHKRLILDNELREIGDEIVSTVPGGRGMPLGVEPSQAEMIALPSPLDNYIKCQLRIKCAGHYMDDYYVIVPPEEDPRKIMQLITEKARAMGLTVSPEKSRIIPLCKPFKYCKAKYRFSETGRIIVTGSRSGVKRDRRKIKAFKAKLDSGEISYEDLWTSVNGMLAYFEGYDDHRQVLKLRRLFYAIYGFSAENIDNFRRLEKAS